MEAFIGAFIGSFFGLLIWGILLAYNTKGD